MNRSPPSFLAPAVVVFATLAVILAGLGGLVSEGRNRTLLAAGSAFWLAMLFVPWIFIANKGWPQGVHSGISAAFGALLGLCFGLCFASHSGLPGLLSHAGAGAFLGFVSYWLALFRTLPYWRRDPD